jgi:phosphatidylserine/phosphatidylglycerophosphate/cardiolipin synthase-like enzyme
MPVKVHGKEMRGSLAVTFYSPVDDVHGALIELIRSAKAKLSIAMYGFDDNDLAAAIYSKLHDDSVQVELTLDSSQAGGVHEKALLSLSHYPSNSIAIGRSEKGAIMHLKLITIDDRVRVSGSTNWSMAGETKQDNELTVIYSATLAKEAGARMGEIHRHMLSK